MERIIRRNEELEDEVERLRAQLAQTQTTKNSPHQISQELLIPQEVSLEWIPDPDQRGPSWSHGGPDGPISRGARISNRDAPSSAYPVDNQAFPQEQETYDDATEDPQQLCTPTAIPIWNDPMAFGTNAQQDYQKQNTTAWTPFHPALTQPSRFADLNPTGFSEVSPYLKHVFITPMRPYSNYFTGHQHTHICNQCNKCNNQCQHNMLATTTIYLCLADINETKGTCNHSRPVDVLGHQFSTPSTHHL